MSVESTQIEPIALLTKDIREAARTLTPREARFLVNYYYTWQESRKRADNMVRSMEDAPHGLTDWLAANSRTVEENVKKALRAYSQSTPTGSWAESITGVGPVISAGLLAHIDIEQAPTVGHIWRFGGYDPTVKWERGQKRPWNADLKLLFWKCGESFAKQQSRESDVYGKIYVARKALEVERNESGLFAEVAKQTLEARKFDKSTETYKAYMQGKLPAGRLDLRAKRYATKLFLSHWHTVAFFVRYGQLPPLPYPIVHLGHGHYIDVPNAALVDGLPQALRNRWPSRGRSGIGRQAVKEIHLPKPHVRRKPVALGKGSKVRQ